MFSVHTAASTNKHGNLSVELRRSPCQESIGSESRVGTNHCFILHVSKLFESFHENTELRTSKMTKRVRGWTSLATRPLLYEFLVWGRRCGHLLVLGVYLDRQLSLVALP